MTKQLTLYDAMKAVQSVQFDDAIRRVEVDGVVYFSILDVFQRQGSSGSAKNPAQYWKRAKARIEGQGGDITGVLERTPSGGGKPSPYATFKMFFRIAQVVDIHEWEYIRQWMADLAHERLEEMVDPELGIDRASQRFINIKMARGMSKEDAKQLLAERVGSKQDYKALTDAIKLVCTDTPHYGRIINQEYLALFGAIKSELEAMLNTKSIRDELPYLSLTYLRAAEAGLKATLQQKGRLSNEEIINTAYQACVPLGQNLKALCQALGISHITGLPLLGGAK